MKVATLICKRDLPAGRLCLDSLVTHCANLDELLIFEDGSLAEQDRADLARLLRPGRVLSRTAIEPEMDERLASYPRCRQFRRENPLGLKLLDVPLLGGLAVPFCDSDILFLRPFSLTAVLTAARDEFVFMKDVREGYSARLYDLVFKHGLAMPSRINTGFYCAPERRYDLDFIEWFLGIPEFRVFPQIVEQTCWAAMAGTASLLNPQQAFLAGERTVIRPSTVAVHFFGHHKSKIAEYHRESVHTAAESDPVELSLVRAPRLGLGRMIRHSLGRRLGRLVPGANRP